MENKRKQEAARASEISTRATQGALGSQYREGMSPERLSGLGVIPTAGDMTPEAQGIQQQFGQQGTTSLYERNKQMQEQTRLDTQKKMEDLQDQTFNRNIKKWDSFNKHIEFVNKTAKGDMPLDQKTNIIKYTNQMAENLLGIKGLDLSVLDDSATIKEKWNSKVTEQMMGIVDGVGKNPTEKSVNRALVAIDRAENFTGLKFESVKQNLKSQMADQRGVAEKQRKPSQGELENITARTKAEEAGKKIDPFEKHTNMALDKWFAGGELSTIQKKLVDKKMGIADLDEIEAKTRRQIQAKIKEGEKQVGRPFTADEKRSIIINDPFGFLAPGEKPEGVSWAVIKNYMEKHGLTMEEVFTLINKKQKK